MATRMGRLAPERKVTSMSGTTPFAPVRMQAQVAPVATPDLQQLITLAVAVVMVAALYLAREVLVPMTLAVLLSFLLAPLVGLLRRLRLGRVPSVILAVLFALGIILTIGGLIGTQVAQLATNFPKYATTIEKKVSAAQDLTIGRLTVLADRLGRQFEQANKTRAKKKTPAPTPRGQTQGKPAAPPAKPTPVEVRQAPPSPLQVSEQLVRPILSPLATAGIVFVVAIFILLQKEDLRDRMIRLFGSSDLHRTTFAIDDGAHRLSRYFLTQLAINTGFGCVIGIGLFAIGVPSPVLWGILAALLRFVPYIGSFISGALPAVVAAGVEPGWSMAIWTVVLFVVGESFTGQVVEPVLYGRNTGLSPFAVIIAAIFWSWLWGPIGLILSTPLTVILVGLGRHVKRLEFLDVLLGDQPALTPVESFYQRILAGDADEAQDQAEALLKECSLSTYYDEVAIKGLQLAATDVERGVMSAAQLERVREATMLVVAEFDGRDDNEPDGGKGDKADGDAEPQTPGRQEPLPDDLPDAWRGGTPVLCIAGRGALDGAGAAMLAQLLGKHGLGARIVGSEDVSRTRIGSLDAESAAIVCICSLETASSLPYLRYLVRRLRQRVTDAPVIVGLWPPDDPVLADDRQRAVVAADRYAGTLRETVRMCLEVARESERAEAPAA